MASSLDTAVCDVCDWEGTEADIAQPGDGVVADTCPRCKQDAVNYFFPDTAMSSDSSVHRLV
jgi:hypothetical protein